MERRRRIAAYGLCHDREGRVLLVRARLGGAGSGRWFLPGGGVAHGEHPERAVIREVREETGLRVRVDGVRQVITDLEELPDVPALRHHDRLIFNVTVLGGDLRGETGGSSERAAWVALEDLVGLEVMPFVLRGLGLPSRWAAHGAGGDPTGPEGAGVYVDGEAARLADLLAQSEPGPVVPAAVPTHHQRFAAYGLVTDPVGRILLTRISDGYPGGGRWHLPGGGTDFGEDAETGLLRELFEEADQQGRITGLLAVSHRHQRETYGPEGTPIDWHGVRVIFRAEVDQPTVPRVMEGGGSTAEAAWFEPNDALSLQLTEVAQDSITHRNGP